MNIGVFILWFAYWTLQIFLASYLLQPLILLLIYFGKKIAARKDVAVRKSTIRQNYQFAIVITAHQETTYLPPIIDSLLKQVYPYFNVYIVADDCDTSQLLFEDPRINILSPPVPLNNKSKSIRYALERFKDEDEILVIFDPDNLVHPGFLTELNKWYNMGYLAVQGCLYSKNTGGAYEKMDGAGALFNNFMDRDMRFLLGFSVNIWGCGISVDRQVYKKIIYTEKSRTGGFDKHMQVEIAKNVPRIGYAGKAILYDEKVSNGQTLERQRTRWIYAYFKFFGEATALLAEGMLRGNLNLFYFGYNLVRPPYFLQLSLACLLIWLNWSVYPGLSLLWMLILSAFILSFIFIVMISTAGGSVSKGIWYMPLFFYHQVRSLFKIRMSKHTFLKTEHSRILYIDDLLKHAPHP
jgi:glycosyltransferase involved in cell wall biosynthesis